MRDEEYEIYGWESSLCEVSYHKHQQNKNTYYEPKGKSKKKGKRVNAVERNKWKIGGEFTNFLWRSFFHAFNLFIYYYLRKKSVLKVLYKRESTAIENIHELNLKIFKFDNLYIIFLYYIIFKILYKFWHIYIYKNLSKLN